MSGISGSSSDYLYRPSIGTNFKYVCHFQMGCGPMMGQKYVGVMKYEYQRITYYFIDNLEYFECFYPYGDNRYDIKKFIFFDKAVLSMLPVIDSDRISFTVMTGRPA